MVESPLNLFVGVASERHRRRVPELGRIDGKGREVPAAGRNCRSHHPVGKEILMEGVDRVPIIDIEEHRHSTHDARLHGDGHPANALEVSSDRDQTRILKLAVTFTDLFPLPKDRDTRLRRETTQTVVDVALHLFEIERKRIPDRFWALQRRREVQGMAPKATWRLGILDDFALDRKRSALLRSLQRRWKDVHAVEGGRVCHTSIHELHGHTFTISTRSRRDR